MKMHIDQVFRVRSYRLTPIERALDSRLKNVGIRLGDPVLNDNRIRRSRDRDEDFPRLVYLREMNATDHRVSSYVPKLTSYLLLLEREVFDETIYLSGSAFVFGIDGVSKQAEAFDCRRACHDPHVEKTMPWTWEGGWTTYETAAELADEIMRCAQVCHDYLASFRSR